MTPTAWVAMAVPIVVAVVSGAFAYLQARKIADRNASMESRKIDLSEYESLNHALRDEIEKLRGDRIEDSSRHQQEIQKIAQQIRELELRMTNERQRMAEMEQKLRRLASWARTTIGILREPDVARLLAAGAVTIPPPPVDLELK